MPERAPKFRFEQATTWLDVSNVCHFVAQYDIVVARLRGVWVSYTSRPRRETVCFSRYLRCYVSDAEVFGAAVSGGGCWRGS